MPDIDKITLEVEGKATDSTKGIDDLITKLTSLSNVVNQANPQLKSLSSSFNGLIRASKEVQNIDFTKMDTSMRQLGQSLNILNTYTKDMQNLGNVLKNSSSGINSMKRAMSTLGEASPNINKINTTNITSQIQELSKLGQISDSFTKMKEGSKSFNSAVNTMNKGADKFPEMMKKINNLDLTKFKEQVKTLASTLGTFTTSINSTSNAVKDFSKIANTLPTSITKATNAVTKAQKSSASSSNLGGPFGLGGGVNMLSNLYMLRRLGQGFGFVLGKANDFVETMNLFNVVMGENTNKAMKFNEAMQGLGVDQEQAMRYQSSFYDIGKSLGMTTKNAYTLSEQFTKLAYDYSSLYNIPVEQSFEKLQSGIVGVVRPLRGLGKDISEAKLKETALTLGIEDNVRMMTQSDKVTLRFITLMRQSGSAMNDLERTIHQPANALRILKAQFTSLVRELGALFIPMLSAVLPYLIAFTKFLRMIIKDIAGLFGIKLFDIDFKGVTGSLGVADDYTNNISDNLDDGAKNAKKIKDFMLGIDELNVLNPDTGTVDKDKGASGAGSKLGGLDLEQYGYEKLLKGITSQADEIFKTLEEWKTPILAVAGLLGAAGIFGKLMAITGLAAGPLAVAIAGIGAALGIGYLLFDKTYDLTNDWGFSLAVGLAPLLGPIPLAIWGIYEAFQPVIKRTDVLGAKISDVTKKKMGPFIETFQDLSKEITKVEWSGLIKDSDIDSIKSKVDSMSKAVIDELSADKNNELKDLDMLKGLKGITQEQYNDMLGATEEYYSHTTKETEDAQGKINEILERYRGKNIELTKADSDELKRLNNIIKDNAVSAMSESAEEQMLILNRLKYNEKALTIEAGSEILVEAKKNHDQQVKDAEDWKGRMMSNLDKKFYEEGTITKEEYDKQKVTIDTAYGEMIQSANGTYDNIAMRVKTGMGDQYKYIDEGSGKIKENWKVWLEGMGKKWDDFWGGLKTWWGEKTADLSSWWNSITSDMTTWSKGVNEKWNNFWGGLGTWYQGITDGLGKWWDGIKKDFGSWCDDFAKGWDDFWGGLGTWWDETNFNPGNWNFGGGKSRMAVGVDFMPTAMPIAFATGGFVPQNANFISPDSWTAGENGRKELIGSYKGRTTVMPLENTSFVSTMYEAVYDAVRDASREGETTIVVQPQVHLGPKDVYQSQEEYKFSSGGSLIKKR